MKKASTNGRKLSYADSHSVVRLSSKRFEQSPYSDKYVNEKTVFGLYSNRFYPLTLGGDAIDDYWQLRQSVVLYDVPEKPHKYLNFRRHSSSASITSTQSTGCSEIRLTAYLHF